MDRDLVRQEVENIGRWLNCRDSWIELPYYGPWGWKGKHRVWREWDRCRALGCNGTVLALHAFGIYGMAEVQFDKVVSVEDGISYSKLYVGVLNLGLEVPEGEWNGLE